MSKIIIQNKDTRIEQNIVVESIGMKLGSNEDPSGYGSSEERIYIHFHQRNLLGINVDKDLQKKAEGFLAASKSTLTLTFHAMTYEGIKDTINDIVYLINNNQFKFSIYEYKPSNTMDYGDLADNPNFKYFDIEGVSTKYIREVRLAFRYMIDVLS